jgi:hypothetical protein
MKSMEIITVKSVLRINGKSTCRKPTSAKLGHSSPSGGFAFVMGFLRLAIPGFSDLLSGLMGLGFRSKSYGQSNNNIKKHNNNMTRESPKGIGKPS